MKRSICRRRRWRNEKSHGNWHSGIFSRPLLALLDCRKTKKIDTLHCKPVEYSFLQCVYCYIPTTSLHTRYSREDRMSTCCRPTHGINLEVGTVLHVCREGGREQFDYAGKASSSAPASSDERRRSLLYRASVFFSARALSLSVSFTRCLYFRDILYVLYSGEVAAEGLSTALVEPTEASLHRKPEDAVEFKDIL